MSAIFYPVIALVALTFVVLLLMPYARFRAGFAGRVKIKDFRLVHLTYNNVLHRLAAYAASTVALAALWVRLAVALID